MNITDIQNKFTDGEIISYAEFIRRLPNHFAFREVLLDIPHSILFDSFRVMKLENEIRLCEENLDVWYPWVEIKFNTFDIDSIEIVEPDNSDLDPDGDY